MRSRLLLLLIYLKQALVFTLSINFLDQLVFTPSINFLDPPLIQDNVESVPNPILSGLCFYNSSPCHFREEDIRISTKEHNQPITKYQQTNKGLKSVAIKELRPSKSDPTVSKFGLSYAMKTVSMTMTCTFPISTSSSKLRRLNRRFTGMAFASGSKETATLGVKVADGSGNLPKVVLTSSHGSEAELYLYGGCVTSWKVGSKDFLFVRPDAVFNGQKPISGGVPHCFPQFGPGPMQQHGFARNSNWSIVNSENVEGKPVVTLELKDSPYSRSMWDYSFHALYKITLDKKSLLTELKITNTDKSPFSFTTALHTYFSASAAAASVSGLKGCKTLNKDPDPKNPVAGMEERDVVTFPGFVDCVYLDAPNVLSLNNGLGDVISIKNTNWSDAVLWNPYLTMEACYKDFVCVENAKIGTVKLEPEQSWTATQELSVA